MVQCSSDPIISLLCGNGMIPWRLSVHRVGLHGYVVPRTIPKTENMIECHSPLSTTHTYTPDYYDACIANPVKSSISWHNRIGFTQNTLLSSLCKTEVPLRLCGTLDPVLCASIPLLVSFHLPLPHGRNDYGSSNYVPLEKSVTIRSSPEGRRL